MARTVLLSVPPDPWNQITPNLWQGGGLRHHPGYRAEDDGFDAVLTLMDGYPLIHAREVVMPCHDNDVIPPRLGEAVDLVREWLAAGLKVGVRCEMGLNRSGLVVAQTLCYEGWEPREVIDLMRRVRGQFVLCNPHFEAHLLGRDLNGGK